MYQGDRPDLTDKMNLVAQRQRRTLGTLATDVVARSAYAAVGDLVTGHGADDPQAVPLGAEGMVLTAAPGERGGVRWAPSSGGGGGSAEIDSDGNGNVWEGDGALSALTSGTNNTAVGFNALFDTTSQSGTTGIGTRSRVTGTGGTAIGYQTHAGGNYSFAGGWQATALGLDGVALGDSASASGDDGTALGAGASASGAMAVAINGIAAADGAVAIGRDHLFNFASSGVQDLIVLGTSLHTTRIPGIPAFTAADKYLVVDASGNIHRSALGPAS